MVFSLVSNTKSRRPVGNRWEVTAKVDEVDNTGSYVAAATLGLSHIDSVVATCVEDAVAVQVSKNSQTSGGTEDDGGDVWLKTASGTHDVEIRVVGR